MKLSFLTDSRSCVDELELCKGFPLCKSMEDLKWCRSSDAPAIYNDWQSDNSHIVKTLSCNTLDLKPQGQQIEEKDLEDRFVFNCLNRRDENPFLSTKRNEKTWLDWVNTPCEDDEYQRRCLGDRPEYCINSKCEWYCIKQH